MTVADALAGVTQLGVDSVAFIYLVEANPAHIDICRLVFQHVSTGAITAYTSTLTLTETLVHPIRKADAALEDEYRRLLLETRGVHCTEVDEVIARRGAELRASYGLRTPDALQVATALNAGCEAFLTNDAGLRRVVELRVLVLGDLTL